MSSRLADGVAIAGAGWAPFSRESGRSPGDLALEACLAAVHDAGLAPADVDGIASYPASVAGSVPAWYVQMGLGIPGLRWFADLAGNGPAALTAVIEAAYAVAAGACDVALAFRAITRPRRYAAGGIPPGMALQPDLAFKIPYGAATAAHWLAFYARRHMYEFGTTEEHLGHVAVAARSWAARNERAIARQPITLDDYFASRYVAEPFRLLDCDYPVDGAVAVVLTTPERARDLRHVPAIVRSVGLATGPVPDWDQAPDLAAPAGRHAATDMWRRAGDIGPADVDVAEVYDGFTFLAISWLEALGLCPVGEGGPFVASGATAPGGTLPTNTHGGNLSEGRMHGMGHVAEAVHQLQGRAGERQIPDAEVAVVTGGGGPLAGCLLLHT